MEVFIDHYIVLGLPSGEEVFKVSEKEITKAYRLKALELHPDKRGDNPNAVTEFQALQSSYEILKDENSRREFDACLMSRLSRQKVLDPKEKKRRRMSREERKIEKMRRDLEKREHVSMMFSINQRKVTRMRYDLDDKQRARLINNLVRYFPLIM